MQSVACELRCSGCDTCSARDQNWWVTVSIELKESGFHEWHDYIADAPGLGVNSARVEECLARYRQQQFQGLFGCPSFGFSQQDMDFLTEAPDVRWLWFWDVSLRNIDPIYGLTKLEHLGINPKRPGIDFSRLRALQTVVNHWIKADTGITDSSITQYNLWHYKPATKSFQGLQIPAGVRRLELYWANPATLEGLPVLRNLEVLQFHRCRNLQDLSALPRIAPNLQTLLTTTSSKIDATAGVQDHPTLKTALISGNLVVGSRPT